MASVSKLALLSVLAFTLLPAQRLHKGKGHRIEKVDDSRGDEAHRLIKIYSVLKTNNSVWAEGLIWTLAETILGESIKYSLDPMLVLAVINVESRFQHRAISQEGARGLMQLRPVVAHALATELALGPATESGRLVPEYLDDPIVNVRLGVCYLGQLKKSFKETNLALAAYHWGPTDIKNRLEEGQEVPLEYAMKVLSAYQTYRIDNGAAHKLR